MDIDHMTMREVSEYIAQMQEYQAKEEFSG
jgi:hypothetical protein